MSGEILTLECKSKTFYEVTVSNNWKWLDAQVTHKQVNTDARD